MTGHFLAPGTPDSIGAPSPEGFCDIIGRSAAMREVFDLIAKVAPTHATVLIIGESGTGKELVAAAIHRNSPRRDQSFISQNCSALNDNLLESELFGHMRGAFTGAVGDKPGLFDLADAGTLFLDEVTEMSPALQVKLLRVLQESTFLPLGGTLAHHVDVRLVSAASRPLEDLVRGGVFREDLYYRLNVFRIDLPPLRERLSDVPLLARHFLHASCAENGLPAKAMAPDVLHALRAYAWPGNVRELQNEMQRLSILARDAAVIAPEHLSPRIREAAGGQLATPGRRLDGPLTDALEHLERQLLAEGLERNRWNKSLTARELGISRANLVAKVRKYRLCPHDRDTAHTPGCT